MEGAAVGVETCFRCGMPPARISPSCGMPGAPMGTGGAEVDVLLLLLDDDDDDDTTPPEETKGADLSLV